MYFKHFSILTHLHSYKIFSYYSLLPPPIDNVHVGWMFSANTATSFPGSLFLSFKDPGYEVANTVVWYHGNNIVLGGSAGRIGCLNNFCSCYSFAADGISFASLIFAACRNTACHAGYGFWLSRVLFPGVIRSSYICKLSCVKNTNEGCVLLWNSFLKQMCELCFS
jgi:hypothetical protein